MQNWKLKYNNRNQKTDNTLKSYMHYLTQHDDLHEYQDQQIMNQYLQKHIELVNQHRNEEKIELEKMRQQLKIKLKQRKKSRQISLRRIKQYDDQVQLQHKIYINNPNIKETNKNKLLKTQTDSCKKLVNDIKRRSAEKKIQFSQMCIRQNQQSTLPTILPQLKKHNQYNYNDQYNRGSHGISTHKSLPFQNSLINERRSKMILSNSVKHDDLRKYRSRYYNNSESAFKSCTVNNEQSKQIEFQSSHNSPQKRLLNYNYEYNSLNQNSSKPPRNVIQLLNLYKLQTQISQDQEIPQSKRSKQRYSLIKRKKTPINFKSKQKQIDQLYKSNVRGSQLYRKIKELKSKKY